MADLGDCVFAINQGLSFRFSLQLLGLKEEIRFNGYWWIVLDFLKWYLPRCTRETEYQTIPHIHPSSLTTLPAIGKENMPKPLKLDQTAYLTFPVTSTYHATICVRWKRLKPKFGFYITVWSVRFVTNSHLNQWCHKRKRKKISHGLLWQQD